MSINWSHQTVKIGIRKRMRFHQAITCMTKIKDNIQTNAWLIVLSSLRHMIRLDFPMMRVYETSLVSVIIYQERQRNESFYQPPQFTTTTIENTKRNRSSWGSCGSGRSSCCLYFTSYSVIGLRRYVWCILGRMNGEYQPSCNFNISYFHHLCAYNEKYSIIFFLQSLHRTQQLKRIFRQATNCTFIMTLALLYAFENIINNECMYT